MSSSDHNGVANPGPDIRFGYGAPGLKRTEMTEGNEQGRRGQPTPTWRQRLDRAARLLVVVAATLAILAAADLVSVAGALVAMAIVTIMALTMPPLALRSTERAPAAKASDAVLPGTMRLAQSLPDPCFILSGDGTVLYANHRAVATFSIEAGETLPFRLRHPEIVAAFGRLTRGGGPQQVEFVEKVPTERTFLAWFAELEQVRGQEAFLLLLHDLTDTKAAERMRVDFVANASHELRTPLASLSGFIETLQGAARDDAVARDRFLSMMHEQAMRMSRLIDDLLSLSRIEMRAHVQPRDKVDLAGLLSHVVDTLAPLASELGVAIEAQLPDEKVIVSGDHDELVQVFNNLIENACKYGQTGERVVVKLETVGNGGACSVAVIDFGPGIAPEHLPRLTERFYRIDADESRRHRGTGLGLAIVKHIASRHRARLQIESRPGAGAKFILHFPDSESQITGREEKTKAIQRAEPS